MATPRWRELIDEAQARGERPEVQATVNACIDHHRPLGYPAAVEPLERDLRIVLEACIPNVAEMQIRILNDPEHPGAIVVNLAVRTNQAEVLYEAPDVADVALPARGRAQA
jgi:hypothetical protein